MRVIIRMEPVSGENREIDIPLDFRRSFISMLKTLTAGSKSSLRFDEEKPGYSPYVFAVTFNGVKGLDSRGQVMRIKTPIYVTISSGLYDFITAVSNGAIANKDTEMVLGLKISSINLEPLKKIENDRSQFKMIGHAVFRGKESYIDGSNIAELEESINTQLYTRLNFLAERYQLQIPLDSIGGVQIVETCQFRKGVCYHYGGQLTTLQGEITLAGTINTLQFLYDYGLGVRTGQGFGLLEVK